MKANCSLRSSRGSHPGHGVPPPFKGSDDRRPRPGRRRRGISLARRSRAALSSPSCVEYRHNGRGVPGSGVPSSARRGAPEMSSPALLGLALRVNGTDPRVAVPRHPKVPGRVEYHGPGRGLTRRCYRCLDGVRCVRGSAQLPARATGLGGGWRRRACPAGGSTCFFDRVQRHEKFAGNALVLTCPQQSACSTSSSRPVSGSAQAWRRGRGSPRRRPGVRPRAGAGSAAG